MACTQSEQNKNTVLFEIIRGDDCCFLVEIRKALATDPVTYSPIDITGWIFTTTLKLNPGLPDTARGVLQVTTKRLWGEEAKAGYYYLELSAEQTRELLPAPYFFDIQHNLDGKTMTVMTGRLRVVGDITRKP